VGPACEWLREKRKRNEGRWAVAGERTTAGGPAELKGGKGESFSLFFFSFKPFQN
jgi:hypothetical protein